MATGELRTLFEVLKGRQLALRKRAATAVLDVNDALDRAERVVGQLEDETKDMNAATADLQRELQGLGSNGGPPLELPSVPALSAPDGSSALVGVHPAMHDVTVVRK